MGYAWRERLIHDCGERKPAGQIEKKGPKPITNAPGKDTYPLVNAVSNSIGRWATTYKSADAKRGINIEPKESENSKPNIKRQV